MGIIKYMFSGQLKYRYEYYSPFGESWDVYRVWLGFIPIVIISFEYKEESESEVIKFINKLNAKK